VQTDDGGETYFWSLGIRNTDIGMGSLVLLNPVTDVLNSEVTGNPLAFNSEIMGIRERRRRSITD